MLPIVVTNGKHLSAKIQFLGNNLNMSYTPRATARGFSFPWGQDKKTFVYGKRYPGADNLARPSSTRRNKYIKKPRAYEPGEWKYHVNKLFLFINPF